MQNIELKVKVPSLEMVLERTKLSAVSNEGVLKQTDTYFHTKRGRLKLRETNGNNFELIYYNRPDTEVSKVSHYHIIPLARDESGSVIKVLSETNGVKVVVQKERELLLYKHTRIHLDKVADLGEFVELETVVKNISMSDGKIEHKEIIGLLGLDQFEKCKASYSDMLLK